MVFINSRYVHFVALLILIAFTFACQSDRKKRQVDYHYSPIKHANHSIRHYLTYPTNSPDRIILNLTTDPTNSVAVNWRTDTTINESFAQIALASHGPYFVENAREISGKKEAYNYQREDELRIFAHYFSCELDGLQPGEKYVYRVGHDEEWSEWFQFRIHNPDSDPISFIYFGDAQNDVKSMWSRVIREAYGAFGEIDFMLHAGDLINRHDRELEWGEWFYAGGFIHAMIPSVMTPGNHEYGDHLDLSPQWRPQFNLPTNGPEGHDETCYQINYPNLKIVSLDTELIDESDESMRLQEQWLDSILSNDPRKWTAITLHYPVFSTKPNRDNPKLRAHFKPLFDKYRVDIVLQGHDHAYGRGMVNNVPTGYSRKEKTSGTMYVVSVSGPKMYDVSDDPWMDRKAAKTQLFQHIQIENDTLTYKAFTARGDLYDSFHLVKRQGQANQLINKIPDIKEIR